MNPSTDCIDCKACMKGCLMMGEFTDSPKTLLENIKNSPADMAFSCAVCGYCSHVCPKDISIEAYFIERKKELAPTELKNYGYRSVLFHQVLSFSKTFTTIKKFSQDDYSNMAFMPGCALSSYSPELVKSIIKYLRSKLPGINVLMQCCGKPMRIVGDMKRFEKYYGYLESDIQRLGVDTVVTACENCYMSLKNLSPHVKTVSLYEVLADVGIPERDFSHVTPVALHDPCPTRYEKSLHEAVRKILHQMKLEFEEFKFNRTKTQCCGSGGMLALTNPKLSREQMVNRANQTQCDTIVSYCQECCNSMTRGGKKGVHILDLLFDEEVSTSLIQPKMTTIKSWLNRYKTKRMITKLEG